eukprot:PRCOL_00003734-RA
MGGSVFVTVGTTSFDALISAVDRAETARALAERGYTSATLQIGRGEYEPHETCPACTGVPGFSVDYYRFKGSLAEDMASASLVVSHAGSGSIFEALALKKPLVVVVNEALMDNHQQELAGALASRGYLVSTTPARLVSALETLDTSALKPYPGGDPAAVAQAVSGIVALA